MELLCECDTLLRRGGGFAKGGDVIAFTPKEALERRNGIIRKKARERTLLLKPLFTQRRVFFTIQSSCSGFQRGSLIYS